MVKSLVVLALIAVGCGSRDATPPPPPLVPPPPPTPVPSLPEPAPRSPDLPPGAVVEAIGEGRRLAREGHYLEALAKFDEVATRSGVALGASFVCERGFIAFRAGKLDRAEALLTRGIEQGMTDTRRQTVAACRYNLGRVYETQAESTPPGDERDVLLRNAHDVYARSLVDRENPTVRERLAALPAVPREMLSNGESAGSVMESLKPLVSNDPSGLCAEIVRVMSAHRDADCYGESVDAPECTVRGTFPEADGIIAHLRMIDGCMGVDEEVHYLTMRANDGFHLVATLGVGYFGHGQEAAFELDEPRITDTFVTLVTHGDIAIVDECEEHRTNVRTLFACSRGASTRCGRLLFAADDRVSASPLRADAIRHGDAICDPLHASRATFATSYQLDGDRLTIERGTGALPSQLTSAFGAMPLADFVTRFSD